MATRETPPATRPQRVYFFSTCVVDAMAPGAGMDSIELIRAAGIAVEFPQAQSCCGQPAYTSGYTDEARQVAAAQLDLFPQPWPIVVPSGSCAGMLVHHWPRLFADDPVRLKKAQEIGSRVVEFSEFAVTVLGLAAAPARRRSRHGPGWPMRRCARRSRWRCTPRVRAGARWAPTCPAARCWPCTCRAWNWWTLRARPNAAALAALFRPATRPSAVRWCRTSCRPCATPAPRCWSAPIAAACSTCTTRREKQGGRQRPAPLRAPGQLPARTSGRAGRRPQQVTD
jgi:hypothetical protein